MDFLNDDSRGFAVVFFHIINILILESKTMPVTHKVIRGKLYLFKMPFRVMIILAYFRMTIIDFAYNLDSKMSPFLGYTHMYLTPVLYEDRTFVASLAPLRQVGRSALHKKLLANFLSSYKSGLNFYKTLHIAQLYLSYKNS